MQNPLLANNESFFSKSAAWEASILPACDYGSAFDGRSAFTSRKSATLLDLVAYAGGAGFISSGVRLFRHHHRLSQFWGNLQFWLQLNRLFRLRCRDAQQRCGHVIAKLRRIFVIHRATERYAHDVYCHIYRCQRCVTHEYRQF